MSRHCDTHGVECETFADLGHYCQACNSPVHVDPLDDWSCEEICHRCKAERFDKLELDYADTLEALNKLVLACNHARALDYLGKGSTDGWVRDEIANAIKVLRRQSQHDSAKGDGNAR